jgi:hypothetical protein
MSSWAEQTGFTLRNPEKRDGSEVREKTGQNRRNDKGSRMFYDAVWMMQGACLAGAGERHCTPDGIW